MIVIIDQPGSHGAATQVNGAGAGAGACIAGTAHGCESPVLDGDLGYDGILPIHGHDLAVGEVQIARTGAGRLRVSKPGDGGCYDE